MHAGHARCRKPRQWQSTALEVPASSPSSSSPAFFRLRRFSWPWAPTTMGTAHAAPHQPVRLAGCNRVPSCRKPGGAALVAIEGSGHCRPAPGDVAAGRAGHRGAGDRRRGICGDRSKGRPTPRERRSAIGARGVASEGLRGSTRGQGARQCGGPLQRGWPHEAPPRAVGPIHRADRPGRRLPDRHPARGVLPSRPAPGPHPRRGGVVAFRGGEARPPRLPWRRGQGGGGVPPGDRRDERDHGRVCEADRPHGRVCHPHRRRGPATPDPRKLRGGLRPDHRCAERAG